MKKISNLIIVAAISGLVAFLVTGCVHTPVMVRPAQTNVVEVIRTNVVQIVQTNTVTEVRPGTRDPVTNTIVVTNLVSSMSTNVLTLVSPPIFYTNLSLSPMVETAAKTAGDLAPVPWGGAAGSVVVGLAGAILAAVNNRRRKAALGEKATWQETAGVLVQNVETVRKAALSIPGYTPEIDLHVVRTLETSQRLAGVKDLIHNLVEEHTGDTLPRPPEPRVN